MLLTSSTAFFLFFTSLSTFPSSSKSIDTNLIIVQVKYSKLPVLRAERQPLTLKCTAEYEEEHCGNISVFWCLVVPETSCQPLSDPDRYLTHITETKLRGEAVSRLQDAFVTFLQLTLNDTGFYQCRAECQRSQATAMGHIINVTVTADTNPGEKIRNRSDRCSVDMFLPTVIIIILLYLQKM